MTCHFLGRGGTPGLWSDGRGLLRSAELANKVTRVAMQIVDSGLLARRAFKPEELCCFWDCADECWLRKSQRDFDAFEESRLFGL